MATSSPNRTDLAARRSELVGVERNRQVPGAAGAKGITLTDNTGKTVGKHYKGPTGPTWESADGSKVAYVVSDLANSIIVATITSTLSAVSPPLTISGTFERRRPTSVQSNVSPVPPRSACLPASKDLSTFASLTPRTRSENA